MQNKYKIEEISEFYEQNGESVPTSSQTVYKMLKRSNIDIFKVNEKFHIFDEFDYRELNFVNTEVKFEGYLAQEEEDIKKFKEQENLIIPKEIEYSALKGLRLEARQKLDKIRPISIGQASRISGVSPADITILIMCIKNNKLN